MSPWSALSDFFDHTGGNVTRQNVVPAHMRQELLYRVHNSTYAGQNGIAKTAELFRQRFYFLNFVEYLTNYIKNRHSDLQMKPVKHGTPKPPFLSLATDKHFFGDMLQIDLVGRLPESAGFTLILTAKDVFSKYVLTVPVRNAGASNGAKQLFQVFIRTSRMHKIFLSDMGTAFTARLCEILEVDIDYATVKHPETNRLCERTQASLKQYLGIYENHMKRDWHNYVDFAVFLNKTSY